MSRYAQPEGRGRDEDCSPPPAQIPACAANAPGSSLGSNVGAYGLKPPAARCTAANRIDEVTRLGVRTPAAWRLFPPGETLPSTTSAGSCLPLFGCFVGTTTSSVIGAGIDIQNDVQQRAVNLKMAVVVNIAQLAEFVHQGAYPGSC